MFFCKKLKGKTFHSEQAMLLGLQKYIIIEFAFINVKVETESWWSRKYVKHERSLLNKYSHM